MNERKKKVTCYNNNIILNLYTLRKIHMDRKIYECIDGWMNVRTNDSDCIVFSNVCCILLCEHCDDDTPSL